MQGVGVEGDKDDLRPFLGCDAPIPAEEVGDVVEHLVLHHEGGAADDIHVVLDRHLGEKLQVLGRELGELPGCGSGRVLGMKDSNWVVSNSGSRTKSDL